MTRGFFGSSGKLLIYLSHAKKTCTTAKEMKYRAICYGKIKKVTPGDIFGSWESMLVTRRKGPQKFAAKP